MPVRSERPGCHATHASAARETCVRHAGILKADWTAESYPVRASAVRIDDVVPPSAPICMLKADVEGYEPQVMQTARRLLSSGRVPALQLELTRTPKQRNQTCAAYKMLAHLAHLGYDFKQVRAPRAHSASTMRAQSRVPSRVRRPAGPRAHARRSRSCAPLVRRPPPQVRNNIVDREAPRPGAWATTTGPWASLPGFPSAKTQNAVERQVRNLTPLSHPPCPSPRRLSPSLPCARLLRSSASSSSSPAGRWARAADRSR